MASPLPQVAVRDRVLLWLLHVERGTQDEPGLQATQAGIATAAGLSRAYVSRTVAPLLAAGWVSQHDRRLPGFTRRLTAYRLTERGRQEAQRVAHELRGAVVVVRRGGALPAPTSLGAALDAAPRPLTPWEALSQLVRQGFLDLDAGPPAAAAATFVREGVPPTSATPFVGRSAEARAFRAFQDAPAPALLVEAPAGFGKTTFLTRVATSPSLRSHVAWVRVFDWTSSRQLLDTLDRLLRALGRPSPALSPESEDALAATLGPRVHGLPIVVVLDDFHRADALVRQHVRALLRRAVTEPRFKVVLAGRGPLSAPAIGERPQRISLPPLDPSECAELLDRLNAPPGSRDAILATARGHPLYLTLLASSDARTAPTEDLQRYVALEVLPGLPADQRAVLRVGSSIRGAWSVHVLEELGIGSLATLQALAAANLVSLVTDDHVELHDFVREAVYDAIPFGERREIHAGLAEYYRRRLTHWESVAHYLLHLSRSGQRDAAVRWVLRNRTRLATDVGHGQPGGS